MNADSRCDLCEGTGEITWQQPVAGPGGRWTLTQMSHPCVNGCSGWFRAPSTERGMIVGPGAAPGNVAGANQAHRTEWFLPAEPRRDIGG